MSNNFPYIKNSESLRNFQIESIQWLNSKDGNGLLALPMGAGKCLVSLAYTVQNWLKTLIICPNSVKLVWSSEITKWTDKDYEVINAKDKEIDFNKYFIIINYDIVKKFLPILQQQNFDCVIVDECFPYNTPILTNKGIFTIGNIVENNLNVSVVSCDLLNNVIEYKKIVKKIKNPLHSSLIRIKHSHGEIICTENHKIFIEEINNYVKAKNIKSGTHLRMVQQEVLNCQKGNFNYKILQSPLCWLLQQFSSSNKTSYYKKNATYQKEMLLVQKDILYKTMWKGIKNAKILFQKMLCSMESQSYRMEKKSQSSNERKNWLLERKKATRYILEDETLQSNVQSNNIRKNEKINEGKNIFSKRGKWTNYNSTKDFMGKTKVTQKIFGISYFNKRCKTFIQKCSKLLQGRYCNSKDKTCDRSRWYDSQTQKMEVLRQKKNRNFKQTRVESIKILEPRDYRKFTKSYQRNSKVYNLEIEDNHNYFANNILVSNCHFIKSQKAIRSKAVKKLNMPKKILLTGTPITNTPLDLWNQLNYLNPEEWKNWLYFRNRYIDGYMHYRYNYFIETGTKNIDELSEKIKPFVLRKRKEEILSELPPKIYNKIVINIDGEHLKQYKLAIKNFKNFLIEYTELTKPEIRKRLRGEAFTKVQLLKQICSDHKVEKKIIKSIVENILENNPEDKIVIFSQYRRTVRDLHEQLKESVIFHGDMDTEERKKSVDNFQENKKVKIFVGTIQAAGVGLTLTRASHVIFCDLMWSPSDQAQAEDRCHRIGTHKPVNIFYILSKDTIDEVVYKLLSKKQSTIDQIIDGQEYKKPVNIYNRFIKNEIKKIENEKKYS